MRNTTRWLLGAAAVLALTRPASAQVPMSGLAATTACDALLDASAEKAEFYMVKVPMNGDCTDMQFDLSYTGGPQIGGTSAGAPGLWSVGPNWKVAQASTDTHFSLLLYPPVPGAHANRMVIDGGSTADGGDMGIARVQTVGNSIPVGQDASIGLTLPGNSSQYTVTTRTGVNKQFPIGTTTNGINVAFAPIADVNDNDPGSAGCSIGGRYADPSDTTGNNPTATRGVIIGYNVYRIGGSAASVPTVDDYMAALTDGNAATGFQYFLDIRTFKLGTADTNPGSMGTNAPSDATPNDLTGLQNPDGRMYSGDEVVVFQDSVSNRGTARGANNGTAPVVSNSYWYAFQPVICGKVSQFVAALGFTNNLTFSGTDHRRDLDMDGAFDAVNLDNDAGDRLEFISPQANNAGAGGDGLGLTYSGKLLLSEPVFYDGSGAPGSLPATGRVTLIGQVKGEDVQIQFSTGLESGNIQGYNVYRVVGESHVRVNDQLITARGSEANVYQIVDKARRLAHGGNFTYEVETVYNDGTASTTVGPFQVGEEKQVAG